MTPPQERSAMRLRGSEHDKGPWGHEKPLHFVDAPLGALQPLQGFAAQPLSYTGGPANGPL
jgi:hypothetical protein